MARLYSKKKGKHGSKKPLKKAKPSWVNYDSKTVEQLIVKLAKSGKTAGEIGLILRDSYGIPDIKAITKKKIAQILKENNLLHKVPDDIIALIKKSIVIAKHMETNRKDMPSKRGLLLTESKINRLSKYYKNIGRLPSDWVYDRNKAKQLIE